MDKRVVTQGLVEAVEWLSAQRLEKLGISAAEDDWIVRDPILNFTAPVFWYTQKQAQTHSHAHLAANSFWTNAALYTRRQQTIIDLFERLQPRRAALGLLKGMALVDSVYPNPGLRRMGDIDLLATYEDFGLVVEELTALGWQPRQQENMTLLQAVINGRADQESQIGEWSFVNSKGNEMIDLHWHLIPAIWLRPAYNFTMTEIWAEAVAVPGFDLPDLKTLSPFHTLAYLCLHASQHGLQFLHNLLDIDQFVRVVTTRNDWQWEQFLHLAQRWQIRSLTYHTLLFCQFLFNTPTPANVMLALDPGRAARSRVHRLLRPSDLLLYPRKSPGCRYPSLVKFALIDQVQALAAVLLKVFFPGKAWLNQRYGQGVSLFHHWRHVSSVILRGD
jgi:hypothetical protein